MNARGVLVLVAVFVVVFSAPAGAETAGSPEIDVYVPENVVEPGEEAAIELELRNAGSVDDTDGPPGSTSEVTEARNVSVDLEADDDVPIDVETNTTPVSTMPQDSLRSASFTIAVDEDALAGVYELDAEVSYTYTPEVDSADGPADDETVTETVSVELVVEEQARFSAGEVASGLHVDDTGEVEIELTNDGAENASDAVVRVDSPDEELETVTQDATAYVGDWDVNETATVTAAFALPEDAVARTYPVDAVVEFRDDRGVDRTSRTVRVGAAAMDEQSFSVGEVESTLRVGEDGTVEGTLLNEGPGSAENVVVTIDDDGDALVPDVGDGLGLGPNVFPRETQHAVGDLKVGAEEPFDLRFGVSDEAEPGPRVFEFDVRYRTADGDVRTVERVDVPVEIGDARDEFALEAENATLEVGETDRLELEVTNTYGQSLTDVEAKLFTNDPLDSGDDEAFVPELAPGESTTVSFELSADDDATPQTYPVRLDFRYDDERGDAQLSDTYRVPVTVAEPADDGRSFAWLFVGLAILGGLAAGSWWYRDALLERFPRLEGVLPGGSTADSRDGAAEDSSDPAGSAERLAYDEGPSEADDDARDPLKRRDGP